MVRIRFPPAESRTNFQYLGCLILAIRRAFDRLENYASSPPRGSGALRQRAGTVRASHPAITAATCRLFFSSMIMCALPWMP